MVYFIRNICIPAHLFNYPGNWYQSSAVKFVHTGSLKFQFLADGLAIWCGPHVVQSEMLFCLLRW